MRPDIPCGSLGWVGSFAKRAALIAVIGGSLSATTALPGAFAAEPAVIDAGALRATVEPDPWHLGFSGPSPQAPLEEVVGTGIGPVGALGFRTASGWFRA